MCKLRSFEGERACAQAVIVSEMQALYSSLKARQQPSLPRLAVQYADYAAWQRARLANGELSGSVQYWQRSLRGVPVLQLPTDRPHPAAGISSSGGRVDIRVPAKTVAALRALTAACGTTLFTTMLAAWKVLFVVAAGCLAAIPHNDLGFRDDFLCGAGAVVPLHEAGGHCSRLTYVSREALNLALTGKNTCFIMHSCGNASNLLHSE